MTSGGPRTGAGRKPGTKGLPAGPGRMPQSWRLKLGDKLIVHQEMDGDSTAQEIGQIIELTRTRLTIRVGEIDYVIVR